MKFINLCIISLLLSGNVSASDNRNSTLFGAGLGAIYSGVGGNFALVSEMDMKYVSLGCTTYDSVDGSSCGGGIGWIKTDLFHANSNNHGLGVYFSKVDVERRVNLINGTLKIDEQDVYGLGLSYTYFLSGINSPGLNFGLSIHKTNADYEKSVSGFFQLGYQF